MDKIALKTFTSNLVEISFTADEMNLKIKYLHATTNGFTFKYLLLCLTWLDCNKATYNCKVLLVNASFGLPEGQAHTCPVTVLHPIRYVPLIKIQY